MIVFIYSTLTLHISKNKRFFHTGLALTIFLSLLAFTINGFFMDNIFLLALTLFYFTILITLDLYALSYFSVRQKFAVTISFIYAALSRILLSCLSFIFPLYYTLQAHFMPFMGAISKYILPVLFEALIISAAVTVFRAVKYKKFLSIIELFVISAVCVFATIAYRNSLKIDAPASVSAGAGVSGGLSVSFVQLSFSRNDYILSDNYPGFGEKISQAYLEYAKKTPETRLLVMPESSFPYIDFEDDQTLKELKLLAKQRRQYIISGYYSKKGDRIYNSVILINPDGEIADIYSKNSVVPIFESKWAAVSNERIIFNIDGCVIQPMICYETVFMSMYQYKHSNLFVAVGNAAFSEGIAYSRLHNAYGVFYSRTFGIPYLQITQDGPSFYVDKNYKLRFLSASNEISYNSVLITDAGFQ
ncbi:MAG: carbon-nitrogen hydrolase family protein [Spirochaetaceae bacterium]|nr:carbon-nitrogen hydrolase family protein [Spirochaetaceae bacterium]